MCSLINVQFHNVVKIIKKLEMQSNITLDYNITDTASIKGLMSYKVLYYIIYCILLYAVTEKIIL